jgi:hypothetical protein
MKPRISWVRRLNCWACWTSNDSRAVGLGFTPKSAYAHWLDLRHEEFGRNLIVRLQALTGARSD